MAATTADEVWALLRELLEAQKETDRKSQETDRQMQERAQETDRRILHTGWGQVLTYAYGTSQDLTPFSEDLTRLLTCCFGPLPPWVGARIAAAPIPWLDAWLDGIFDAPALTDLLGPETESPAH